MNKGKFILFEGFDAVGKSTLLKHICMNENLILIKSPEGLFSQARKYFDKKETSFEDRLSFYSGVAIKSSITASVNINEGNSVIMDRYYYSLIAYHYKEYMNLSDSMKGIYDKLLQPDLIFFIDVDFNILAKRSLNREASTEDDEMFMYRSKHKNITDNYKKILPQDKTVYINNIGDVKDVLKNISRNIYKLNS